MPLARKIGPILASLGIAFVLWLIVRNLDRTPARFTVPVAYEYPEDSVVLLEREPEVEVSVRATKPKLRSLQAAEFVVKVRNPEGRVGREFVVLDTDDVEAPFGVDVERVAPAQFVVRYERRATRSVPVIPDVAGKVVAGYEIVTDAIVARPAEVTVAGPASQFEDEMVVRTERVDVSGRSKDVSRRASLLPLGPGFSVPGVNAVDVEVPIRQIMDRRAFEDIRVEVIEGDRIVSAPNPKRLRVVVEGPKLQVEALQASSLSVIVDAGALEPRTQDYQVEPTIAIAEGACAGCRVASRSQVRVDITVRGVRKARR